MICRLKTPCSSRRTAPIVRLSAETGDSWPDGRLSETNTSEQLQNKQIVCARIRDRLAEQMQRAEHAAPCVFHVRNDPVCKGGPFRIQPFRQHRRISKPCF